MPTRKQRRRREKLQRHEWEEVYVDEEGRELEPDEVEELVPERPSRTVRTGARSERGRRQQPQQRGTRRAVEPPSFRRTMRRGLIFFPIMLVVVFLLGGNEISTVGKVLQTVVLMAFFLPFSYFMDSFVWRAYQRRLARDAAKKT